MNIGKGDDIVCYYSKVREALKDKSKLLLISVIMAIVAIVTVMVLINHHQNGATVVSLERQAQPAPSLQGDLDCRVGTTLNSGDDYFFLLPSSYCYSLKVGQQINLSDVPFSSYTDR